jgi:hypothetical protein
LLLVLENVPFENANTRVDTLLESAHIPDEWTTTTLLLRNFHKGTGREKERERESNKLGVDRDSALGIGK